jgi:hypothetical protein
VDTVSEAAGEVEAAREDPEPPELSVAEAYAATTIAIEAIIQTAAAVAAERALRINGSSKQCAYQAGL